MNTVSKVDYPNLPKAFDNLSAKDKEKVKAVYRIGEATVYKNVAMFCSKHNKHAFYKFYIESPETVGKVFKTKTNIPLGYCSYNKEKIVLNLEHVLLSSVDEIIDTLLHECAHAVADKLYGDHGHGKHWRKVCRMFGCRDRAKARVNDEFAAKIEARKKYKIVALTGSKVWPAGSCNRKLKELRERWINGDKARLTRGRLWHVPMSVYLSDPNNYELMVEHAFR